MASRIRNQGQLPPPRDAVRYAAMTKGSHLLQIVSLAGTISAMLALSVCTAHYAGDMPWAQRTVSWLCAADLPNGNANSVRLPAITSLFVLCVSMALVFQLISLKTNASKLAKTIQVSGIGAMVYALLTITPMHNLMVTIALAFFVVAMLAIVILEFQNRQLWVAGVGLLLISLKLCSFALYLADSHFELWGLFQKTLFLGTTAWLFIVLWTQPKRLPVAA